MTEAMTTSAVALADLIARTGARNLEIGYINDDPPHQWYARAQYNGDRIIAQDHDTPVDATDALAALILDGGRCTNCLGITVTQTSANARKPIQVDGRPVTAHLPRAQQRRIERADSKSKPPCVWKRDGKAWRRGCDGKAKATRQGETT